MTEVTKTSRKTAVAWTLLGTALCASLFSACSSETESAGTAPPPIELRATVHPARSMTITAQIDGKVEATLAQEGTTIAADSAIVQLSNALVSRDAAVASAQLDWIEARLRRRSPGAAPVPVRSADGLTITARILQLRTQRLDKMKALRGSKDVTARELEQVEVEYLAALRDYNNERRAASGVAPVAADGELLRIEHQKQAAETHFAAERQSLLRITSPIGGTITRFHVSRGQNVFPRDPIADVSDTSSLQVRGSVAPELLRYIKPGMPVDVKILSVPPRTFADEIESVAAVQGIGAESRSAIVVVTITNPDGSIQPNTEALITLRSLR